MTVPAVRKLTKYIMKDTYSPRCLAETEISRSWSFWKTDFRWLRRALFIAAAFTLPAISSADAIRTGFNSSSLPANDDGSTGEVALGFGVNLFGEAHTGIYVNNNGNLTFNAGLSKFTPEPITN